MAADGLDTLLFISEKNCCLTFSGNFCVSISGTEIEVLWFRQKSLIPAARCWPSNNLISASNIRARLREGFTPEEQQLTVDYMHAKWGDDLEMAEYLRPSTLFQPSKFPGYLEGANAWNRAGRPARKNGKWDRGEVAVDTSERDSAYRRFISGVAASKAPSDLEKLVCTEASKASVRGMRSDFAISTWNRIWKECAQRRQQGKSA